MQIPHREAKNLNWSQLKAFCAEYISKDGTVPGVQTYNLYSNNELNTDNC